MASDDPKLQAPAPVLTAGSIKRRPKWRRLGAVIVILLAIAILATIGWWIFSANNQKSIRGASQVHASLNLLQKADLAMQSNNMSELGKVVVSLEKQPSSQNTIDAQYVLAYYYANTGQASKGQAALDQVNLLLSKGQKFSDQISDITRSSSPAILQEQIHGVESQQPVTFGNGRG